MDIMIKYGQDLSVEALNSILALDLTVFGNDILTNEGMALKRFLKFKDSIIAAYSGNTLMGFICFYNVDPSIYQRALSQQEYFDDNLCASDVKPLAHRERNHILMFDLVIDEPFRNEGLSIMLLDAVRDYLKEKHQDGYAIDHVFGFAITPVGFKILSSFGGRKLWTRENISFLELNKELFLRLL